MTDLKIASPHLRVSDPDTSSELARYEAQKLAFAPLLFQACRTMRDLGVLNLLYRLGSKGANAEWISEKTGLSLYAAKLLLEAGLAAGLCCLRDDQKNSRGSAPIFFITKMGVYWEKDKLTRVNAEFTHHVCYRAASHFTESMKLGIPAGLSNFGPYATVYEGLSRLPEEVKKAWFDFDHYYSDDVFEQAIKMMLSNLSPQLYSQLNVVDMGANTGRFSSLLVQHERVSTVTLVDLPQQLRLADEKTSKIQGREKLHFFETDFLRGGGKLPVDQDIYWMSQFLDCFGEEDIVCILKQVKTAIKRPGAQIYILETFWDKQRYDAARYCVIATSLYFACVANGNSKMYHSGEMKKLIDAAGLKVEKEWHELGVAHSLLCCSVS